MKFLSSSSSSSSSTMLFWTTLVVVLPSGLLADPPPAYQTVPKSQSAMGLWSAFPTFAGGMHVNTAENEIYLTGATYTSEEGKDSHCFVSVFRYSSETQTLSFQSGQILGKTHASESCHAITTTTTTTTTASSSASALLVAGSTEQGQWWTHNPQDHRDETTLEYAMLLEFQESSADKTSTSTSTSKKESLPEDVIMMDILLEENKDQQPDFVFEGGTFKNTYYIQSGRALFVQDDTVWMASMVQSKQNVQDPSSQAFLNPTGSDGVVHTRGTNFDIALGKFKISQTTSDADMYNNDNKFHPLWNRVLSLDIDQTLEFADMIDIRRGEYFMLFGNTPSSKDNNDQMQGVMLEINSQDGTLSSHQANLPALAYWKSEHSVSDWIYGACGDPIKTHYFYVVGAMQLKNDNDNGDDKKIQAVVAKVHANDFSTEWKQTFVATTNVEQDAIGQAMAVACQVIPPELTADGAGEELYIAGNVLNGAVMKDAPEDTTSGGNDDIFVAKLSTKDGSLKWMQQIGSNGDDRLARSKAIQVDGQRGNAIVYGDTNGSLFRKRKKETHKYYNDLFVMVLDRDDGSHTKPRHDSIIDELPTVTIPPQSSSEATPQVSSQSSLSQTTSQVSQKKERDPLQKLYIAMASIFGIVLGLCCLGRTQARWARERRLEQQKADVFRYLQKFDVHDIDLRKSPPGGWHGTYLRKLAYGINAAERAQMAMAQRNNIHTMYDEDIDDDDADDLEDDETGRSDESWEQHQLSHSSVVRDSLFMDTRSLPQLGQTNASTVHVPHEASPSPSRSRRRVPPRDLLDDHQDSIDDYNHHIQGIHVKEIV